jgi:hypothetical protein
MKTLNTDQQESPIVVLYPNVELPQREVVNYPILSWLDFPQWGGEGRERHYWNCKNEITNTREDRCVFKGPIARVMYRGDTADVDVFYRRPVSMLVSFFSPWWGHLNHWSPRYASRCGILTPSITEMIRNPNRKS